MKTKLKQLVDGRYGPKTFGNIVFIRNGDDVDINFLDAEGHQFFIPCQGAGKILMTGAAHGAEIELSASIVRCDQPQIAHDICALCGDTRAWHDEHRPRHVFKKKLAGNVEHQPCPGCDDSNKAHTCLKGIP